MPLTTPDLSTDASAAALSGLLTEAAALGVSPLCCERNGVTPMLWAIGAEAPSTARDRRGPFGHSISRAGSRSPALGRRKLADGRSPVRTAAVPLPFLLPDGGVSTFASGTAAIAGMGGDALSAPGAAVGGLSATMVPRANPH